MDTSDESFPPLVGFDGADDPYEEPEEGRRELERRRALMSPDARRRRAYFARYVLAAMGAGVVLCAAALVKTAVGRGGADSEPGIAFAHAAESPGAGASELTPPAASAALAPQAAVPSPQAAAPALVVETPAPAPAAQSPLPSTSAAAPSAPAPSAKKDREAARFALERGDLGGAVTAGERSVAADPTDGEAWLILGAAYQSRGDLTEAVRCYRSCVEKGTRGPKGECRAMAQGH